MNSPRYSTLKQKLSQLNDKIWLSDKWDIVFGTNMITITAVIASGFILGHLLPIVTFDDGSILHTREIFWAGSIGFIIAMGIYGKGNRRSYR